MAVTLTVLFLYPDPGTSVQSDIGPDHSARIDAYVQDQMDGSNIPGVSIAVAERGQVAYTRGFGDDGHGNAVTPETPFWIGSNTKSFTALSVMQLVEAGKVDLDAPVQRYLPEFSLADPDAASQITVRHLLNQTSGLSRSDGLEPVLEERVQTIEQAVADMSNVRPNRPVGESFEYSNLNFVVLGLLVEKVSGQTWQDYIQDNIFDPLGMSHSYTSLEAAKANGLTGTHNYVFGFPLDSEAAYLPGLAPTGYLLSTADDMARYLNMYLNGGESNGNRLLSEAGIETMLLGNTNTKTVQLQSHSFSAQYGEGWFVGQFGAADDARWHLGNLPQFTAWMVLLPETEQAVVVLINAGSQFELAGANAVMSRIPLGIVNILRGEVPPTGIGMTRFFLVFDAFVLAIIALQVWSLIRVAGTRLELGSRGRTIRAAAPLTWELGLGLMLLVAYPGLTGADWLTSLRFLPDLTAVVLIVALLWVATGLTRALKLIGHRVAQHREDASRRSINTTLTPAD
ncbi:MAG TPA: serine hydrolase domain-containing protein [Dehalococcoidia bacterium]|nr:serine hydrolase domain-containing protein [Dehalococcoidia bacterium]